MPNRMGLGFATYPRSRAWEARILTPELLLQYSNSAQQSIYDVFFVFWHPFGLLFIALLLSLATQCIALR